MHYAIIDKEEFIALYKFGEIPLPTHRVIQSASEKEAGQALLAGLKEMPFFEYEEEVLIISLGDLSAGGKLNIRNIRELIPLSEQAKNSYERKFDRHLKFHSPRFESILDEYYEFVNLTDHKNGAKALSEMCDCRLDGSKFVPDQDFVDAFRRRGRGERSHSFQGNFLTHLLVYDRYDFFPNTDVGYLYDLGTILANSKGKPNFVGSGFHGYLEKNRDQFSQLKLRDIFRHIEKSPELDGLRSALTLEESVRLYISGAIYLKYKDEWREVDTLLSTTLGSVVGVERKDHEFIDEFEVAIYLTGLFFGFQKFNKEFYDIAGLSVFAEVGFNQSTKREAYQDNKHKPETTEPEFEITNEEVLENSGRSSEGGENTKKEKIDIEISEESNLQKGPEKTCIKEIQTVDDRYEHEETIQKIEEIFSREGKEKLRISEMKEELGFKRNEPIKNIVKEDPGKRFEITKDGSAEALTKAKPGLFGTTE